MAGLEAGRIRVDLGSPVLKVVFAVGDLPEDHARGVSLEINVEVGAYELDQAFAVGRVVDGESRVQTDGLAVAAQNAHAGRMEGRHPHAVGDGADESGKTLAHFRGGLVGEGDGHDLAGPCAELAQDPCDSTRQHACFAGSGARADEQRRPLVLHRLSLLGVEVPDQFLFRAHNHFRRGCVIAHLALLCCAGAHRQARMGALDEIAMQCGVTRLHQGRHGDMFLT